MKDSPIRAAARVVSVIAVDDDSSILDIIAESISQDCLELLVYENPVLALERLLRHGADILLTDILLPEMSGFDLLDRSSLDCHDTLPVTSRVPRQPPSLPSATASGASRAGVRDHAGRCESPAP